MKRNSKLTAFVIAFSMMASAFVSPVSVSASDTENIIANGSFDSLETGAISLSGITLDGATATVVDGATTTAQSGDKCVLLTNRPNSNYAGLRFVNLPVVFGQAYRFTMYVKLAEPVSAPVYGSVHVDHPKAMSMESAQKELSTTEWTELNFDFGIIESDADPSDKRQSVHIGPNVTNKNVPIYVDSYSLVPISKPELTASYDIADGEQEVSLMKTVTVEFSNDIGTLTSYAKLNYNLKAEDFVINNGASIGNVTKISNCKYTVELKNLMPETEYTLGITERVRDSFGQNVYDSVSFTTASAAPEPFPELVNSAAGIAYADNGWNNATETVMEQDGIYTLTAKNGENVRKGFRVTNLPQDVNTTYKITAKVKDGNPDDGNSPVILSGYCGHNCLTSQYDYTNAKNVTVGDEWTEVSWLLTATNEGTHATDKTLCGAHSGRGPIKGTTAGAVNQAVMHPGFDFKTASGDTLLVKDFSVKKYIPFEILIAGIEDGAVDVETETSFTLSFTNEPYSLSEENIVLTKGDEVVDGKVSVTFIDDASVMVSLSGLEIGTEYTLSLADVIDKYAQPMNWEIGFATERSINILKANGYDYSFENGDPVVVDGTINTEIVSRESGMPAPVKGSKYLKATGISGGFIRINNIGVGKNIQLTPGRTYEISYWARTIPDENGDGTEGSAKGYLSVSAPAINTVYPQNIINDSFEINSIRWTKVTSTVTIAEASPQLDSRYDENAERAYYGIHIGAIVTGVDGVYIDNWEMKEIIPQFDMTASVENGATNVKSNIVKLTFSNPPEGFDESNITGRGAASDVTVEKLSDTEYSLTFGNSLSYGSVYSFTISNVTDSYGQTIADKNISFTAASEPAFVSKNVVPENSAIMYSDRGAWEKESDYVAVDPADGIYTFTAENAEATRRGFRIINLPADVNTIYKVTAKVKDGNPDDGNSPTIVGGHIGHSCLLVSYDYEGAQNITVGDEWTEVSWTLTVKGEGTHPTDKTLCGAHSGRGPIKGTVDGAKYQAVMHTGFEFSTAEGDVLLVKDFAIVSQVAPFEMTSAPESGISNVETDTEFLVSFSNEPWLFDESCITVTADGTEVTAGVKTEKTDGKSYKIILTGLKLATNYSISFTDVIDIYGQALEASPITFTTMLKSNIFDDNGIDFSFENGDTSYLTKDGAQTLEVISASDVLFKAPHGDKILKISGRAANARLRINNVGGGVENCVEAGRKYLVSFYIRAVPDADGNETSANAGVYIANADAATNTVKPSKNNTTTPISVTSGKWTYVEYIVDMIENPYTSDSPVNTGFNMGVSVAGTASVYIDKLVFKEYIPAFEVKTNPENGAVHSSAVVTYTFTNAPESFTADNVQVSGGAASVESISKVSDTVYTVTFDGFEYNTQYTVTVADVTDVYNQPISKTITFTTGSGDPGADNNKLAKENSNYSFEYLPLGAYTGHANNGGTGTGVVNGSEIYTIVNEETEGIAPYNGSQMLKIVANGDANATSHRLNYISNGIEPGKKYRVSYYARTINTGEQVAATVMLSNASPATNLITIKSDMASRATVTNNWTLVSEIVEVIPNAAATVEKPVNIGFHMGVNISGVDVYVDNYQIMELPEEEFHVSSSTPATNSDNVAIDLGRIIFNYSTTLDNSFNPAELGTVKLYKGNTDVTDILVTDVAKGFGNGSIDIDVGMLENNTRYNVIVESVTDYLGRILETSEIVFTTVNAIHTSGLVVLDGAGNALDTETAASSDIAGACVKISNESGKAINKPLFIYTIYNEDFELVKIGSTEFDTQASFAAGESTTLALDFSGESLENKKLSLYLITSFDNLSLAAEPIVLDFTPQSAQW